MQKGKVDKNTTFFVIFHEATAQWIGYLLVHYTGTYLVHYFGNTVISLKRKKKVLLAKVIILSKLQQQLVTAEVYSFVELQFTFGLISEIFIVRNQNKWSYKMLM